MPDGQGKTHFQMVLATSQQQLRMPALDMPQASLWVGGGGPFGLFLGLSLSCIHFPWFFHFGELKIRKDGMRQHAMGCRLKPAVVLLEPRRFRLLCQRVDPGFSFHLGHQTSRRQPMGSQDQVGTMDTWKAAIFPPSSCLFVAFEFLELGI